ncbi:MAG TPA: hypothetical protein VN622_13415 [Clostridia bacterium]|nr:hypothetical protein [Clostridia bacterium]
MENLAPEGQLWWCPECGRISVDRDGQMSMQSGWEGSCIEQALLILQDEMTFDEGGRVVEAKIPGGQTVEIMERADMQWEAEGIVAGDILRRIKEDPNDTLSVAPFGTSRDLVLIHRGQTVGNIFRVSLDAAELESLFQRAQQTFFRWHNDEHTLEVDCAQGIWTLRFKFLASPYSVVHVQLVRAETHDLCEALFQANDERGIS